MGLINNSRFSGGRALLAALLLSCPLPLYAQENGPVLLAAEIETIRKTVQTPDASAAGRREAFTRLARFLTLSGNLEEAADAWFKAGDDMSLLEGARCLIAMGQLDAAEEHVRNILLTGDIREVQREARYLGSQIQAFRTGNGTVLASFLRNDEYADKRPSMLYTLWRVTGEEAYRIRLETEYPSSPEARIIRDAGQVLGAPTAMWLLLPGREGVVLGERAASAGSAEAGAGPAASPPVAAVPAPVPALPAAVPSATAAAGSVVLQTGLFSGEENTRAMADRLQKAGFTALITRRRVNGTEYWAVGVSPGENMNDTILALKDAGFESFPVY
jgi:hypothetical protein